MPYLRRGMSRIRPSICSKRPEKMEIKVGAIILSPGLEPFDPKVKEEYRYGEFAERGHQYGL